MSLTTAHYATLPMGKKPRKKKKGTKQAATPQPAPAPARAVRRAAAAAPPTPSAAFHGAGRAAELAAAAVVGVNVGRTPVRDGPKGEEPDLGAEPPKMWVKKRRSAGRLLMPITPQNLGYEWE